MEKDLDKMTKEELKKAVEELRKKEGEKKMKKEESKIERLMKELLNGIKEPTDEYKEQEEEIREGFERLFEDSTCIVISTNKGVMQVGTKPHIMTCIAQSIQSLLDKKNITMRDVDFLFQTIKEHNSKSMDDELDEMLEKISEIIGD